MHLKQNYAKIMVASKNIVNLTVKRTARQLLKSVDLDAMVKAMDGVEKVERVIGNIDQVIFQMY